MFTPLQVLADGSFLSVMPTPAENIRLGQARAAGRTPPGPPEGHLVRIIEYTVTVRAAGGATRIELFRLVTTLLDHQRAPAAELAALYHERWESENGYAELKTRLRGAAFILRSRSPELVCQELFAFLTVYQALCALETEAARQAGIDPDRISFTVTVRIARDHAASHTIITPHSLGLARRQAIGDLLSDLAARPPRPPVRTRQETAEEQLPGIETRTGKAAQPGHLHNQSHLEGILTCANALTHRHCSSGALFIVERAGQLPTPDEKPGLGPHLSFCHTARWLSPALAVGKLRR